MNACTTVQTFQQAAKATGNWTTHVTVPRTRIRAEEKGDLVDLCYSAGVVEDPLGQGGLP